MEQLIKYFQDKKVNPVLDVGTGTGDFVSVLKEIFHGSKITGIDPNKDSLLAAREKHPDVNFISMSGENLEFPDNEFEAAGISMALHHLPDVGKTLSEMKRVVKPGGWIIVSELYSNYLNPAQEVHKMFHHFRGEIDRLKGVSHNETFKKEEIIDLVLEAGIDIQLHFDFIRDKTILKEKKALDERVEKMKDMLAELGDFHGKDKFQEQIEDFRIKAYANGIQPATHVVVLGKVDK